MFSGTNFVLLLFSKRVTKIIEGGLINKWKQQHWPRQNFCSRGLVTESKAVSLKDIQGAYYALGMLIFLAACILMLEQALKGRRLLPWSEDTKTFIGTAGYEDTNGYVANGYIANGVVSGYTKDVANGYSNGVANGYSNGIGNAYTREYSYSNGYPNGDVANGDVDKKKKKKKKGVDPNDITSGAPVFSRSLWS